MKTPAIIVLLCFSLLAVGCGPSKAEREAAERERQRVELDRQAEAEKRIANEAFRELGKKIGRKPPAIDLGVHPESAQQKPSENASILAETKQP